MIFLSGLIGFLLVLTAEAGVSNSSDVPFCFETEQCLMFDLICESDEYEVRHYDSVKWVSTSERSYFMEMAMMKAFKRLFKYISGANHKGQKIQMTAPVLIKMVDRKKFWQKSEYTMSFLLPAEHQQNPPKPDDTKTYVHDTPDTHVYVRSYGGWMTSWNDQSTADRLSAKLDKVNAKYSKGFRFAAGYNSPMTLFNRHNEVWFVVEGEPVCPDQWE